MRSSVVCGAGGVPMKRGRVVRRQCACGNLGAAGEVCFGCRKKSMLRRKLLIGSSTDPLEEDADRVADRALLGHASFRGLSASLNRRPSGDATGAAMAEAPATVDAALASSGQPLDGALRHDMEARLCGDFSAVRLHADTAAQASASDVDALAYTVGNDIVFGPGRFQPGTLEGRRLIAHELAHVMQSGDTAQPVSTSAPLRRQQPAEPLRPTPPRPVPRAPPSLRVIDGGLSRATARTAGRAGWRQFWRVVIRRFALRGATAVGLAAIDGPLPIGDLIAIGLTLWMIWDLVQLWDTLWTEASQEPERQAEPIPQAQPNAKRDRRSSCRSLHPYALSCEHGADMEEAVIDFLMNEGYGYGSLGDCRGVGSFGVGAIDACGGAPGERWHCRVNGTSDEVSIFSCLCCNADESTGFSWRGPHWSVNLSRRGPPGR